MASTDWNMGDISTLEQWPEFPSHVSPRLPYPPFYLASSAAALCPSSRPSVVCVGVNLAATLMKRPWSSAALSADSVAWFAALVVPARRRKV